MSPDERVRLKRAIRNRLEELKGEIANLNARAAPVVPDNAIGRLTRLDEMLNQGVNETALAQANQLKARLTISLNRAERDDFGECEQCLRAIPVARLLAVPEATMCVACQSENEERA